MKKWLYILLVLLLIIGHIYAQELPSITEEKIEELSEATENDMEDDSYLQNLDYYKRHPVSINTATKEELQVFKFISDLQIDHLLSHRQLLGNLIDIYELQSVPGWDKNTIERIAPYITVAIADNMVSTLRSRLQKGEHYIVFRESKVLEKAKGYDTHLSNHYQGSNDHLFLRYKYQYRNQLQYGIVADKGAGEPFFKGANSNGFDFYSAHIFIRNMSTVKALALGDFAVNMGQGLIQWQSLGFKKSADAMAIKRQGATLVPYSSSGEYYFHRGAGITVKKGIIEATAFASYKPVNANTTFDTVAKQNVITSFIPIGYHRTLSEIENKNSIQQTTFGGSVHYVRNNITMGLNALYYHFSDAIQKNDEPYNIYAIKGKQWGNISFDYSYTLRNMHWFGEAALDYQKHMAFVNGVLISAAPKVDVSLLYRHISQAYQSLYSNAFTENTAPTNESGIYIGVSIRPAAPWKFDAYADFYRFPWLKYNVDAPSQGQDYLLQATYQPAKKVQLYIRYKVESKAANVSNGFTYYASNVLRQNIRLNILYTPNRKLSLRSRAETVWLKNSSPTENGFLTYMEGIYKPIAPLSIALRMQYFHTDSYNSRLYAYEHDVLYSYSVPFFYNKGSRYYINTHYVINKKLDAWLRWAQTIYCNKSEIGSGLETIAGNKKSEIRLQLRYLFAAQR